MSFLSDLVEGNWGHLGTDITHAGSSLMSHPSELYETLGGAAALATGGLALGALAPEALGLGAVEGGVLPGAEGAFGAASDAEMALAAPEVSAISEAPALQAINAALDPNAATAMGFNPADAFYGGGVNTLPSGYDMFGLAGSPGISPPALGSPSFTGGAGMLNVAGGVSDAIESGASLGGISDAAGAVGGAGGGQPGFWSSLGTKALGQITGNPLGAAGAVLAGGGLAYNMMRGSSMGPAQQKINAEAAQLEQQGLQLESYLKRGTLPPALQAQLDQSIKQQKARVIANAAAAGQSTDPRFNSALAQDLNAIELQALASKAATEQKLWDEGMRATGLSVDMYKMLTTLERDDQKSLMNSITAFAAALGSMGRQGPTINLPAGTTVG